MFGLSIAGFVVFGVGLALTLVSLMMARKIK